MTFIRNNGHCCPNPDDCGRRGPCARAVADDDPSDREFDPVVFDMAYAESRQLKSHERRTHATSSIELLTSQATSAIESLNSDAVSAILELADPQGCDPD